MTEAVLVLTIILILLISTLIQIGLAAIPASIARNKGYSFGIWMVYGFFAFVIALIHIAVMPHNNYVR